MKINYFNISYRAGEYHLLYVRHRIISSLLIDLENVFFYNKETELFQVFLTCRMSFSRIKKLNHFMLSHTPGKWLFL